MLGRTGEKLRIGAYVKFFVCSKVSFLSRLFLGDPSFKLLRTSDPPNDATAATPAPFLFFSDGGGNVYRKSLLQHEMYDPYEKVAKTPGGKAVAKMDTYVGPEGDGVLYVLTAEKMYTVEGADRKEGLEDVKMVAVDLKIDGSIYDFGVDWLDSALIIAFVDGGGRHGISKCHFEYEGGYLATCHSVTDR
jgi:hypothetical protein